MVFKLLMCLVIAALVVCWCLLVVWVGKAAESRGRSRVVWGLIALAVGILGPVAGVPLADRLLEGET